MDRLAVNYGDRLSSDSHRWSDYRDLIVAPQLSLHNLVPRLGSVSCFHQIRDEYEYHRGLWRLDGEQMVNAPLCFSFLTSVLEMISSTMPKRALEDRYGNSIARLNQPTHRKDQLRYSNWTPLYALRAPQ